MRFDHKKHSLQVLQDERKRLLSGDNSGQGRPDAFDEVLKRIESLLDSLRKCNELAFISRVERNKFLDIYLGSTAAALKISNKLKQLYAAKVK